ncbi:MAG: peptide chain release factor 2 [Flavobacteriales bacterium]|nr:peptide chain release factor 2 [Flavobacteriales bacterium]
MFQLDILKRLNDRLVALRGYLDIAKKEIEISNLEEKTLSPDFWDNPEESQIFMRDLESKKKWVIDFNIIKDFIEELEVLYDLHNEEEINQSEIDSLILKIDKLFERIEFKNMLSDEGDNLSAVLQITAGAGGTESCDWAEMLMRMYLMWGEKNGFKLKELNNQPGDVAGVKTVTIEIDGEYAFGWLKGENGVHRLVRISPFDSNGKRHTSFASVYVYPLVDDSIEIIINPSDITWETMRSSGAGGQNVNKVETAVRLKHKTSGIVIENSETRSQLENKGKAMQLLKSQLYEIELQKKLSARDEIEASKMKIEWGSQIRNYVMHPYKLIKDVRSKVETADIESVMNGSIDIFLKGYLMFTGQKK